MGVDGGGQLVRLSCYFRGSSSCWPGVSPCFSCHSFPPSSHPGSQCLRIWKASGCHARSWPCLVHENARPVFHWVAVGQAAELPFRWGFQQLSPLCLLLSPVLFCSEGGLFIDRPGLIMNECIAPCARGQRRLGMPTLRTEAVFSI